MQCFTRAQVSSGRLDPRIVTEEDEQAEFTIYGIDSPPPVRVIRLVVLQGRCTRKVRVAMIAAH